MTNQNRTTAEDMARNQAARNAEMAALEAAHKVHQAKYAEIERLQDEVLALQEERVKHALPYHPEVWACLRGPDNLDSSKPDMWLECLRPAVVRLREINARQKRAKGITE